MRYYARIGSKGALTIPIALRRELNIQPGDVFEVSQSDNGVTLNGVRRRCILCGQANRDFYDYHGKTICSSCWSDIRRKNMR